MRPLASVFCLAASLPLAACLVSPRAVSLARVDLLARHGLPEAHAPRDIALPPQPAPRILDPVFGEWWKRTVSLEGTLAQWAANPSNRYDRGGRCNFGITERTYKAHARAVGLSPTREAFEALTPDQAMLIGEVMWRESRSHRIANPGVALVVGDWFWGSYRTAWVRVKNALRDMGYAVSEGGRLDERTLAILNSAPPAELIDRLTAARLRHHQEIVERHPEQARFLAGWQRRTKARWAQARRWVTSPTGKPKASGPA